MPRARKPCHKCGITLSASGIHPSAEAARYCDSIGIKGLSASDFVPKVAAVIVFKPINSHSHARKADKERSLCGRIGDVEVMTDWRMEADRQDQIHWPPACLTCYRKARLILEASDKEAEVKDQ